MKHKSAFYPTNIGIIKISYDDKINAIERVDEIDTKNEKTKLTDRIIEEINLYLNGKLKTFNFYDELNIIGTDFQKSVWNELIKIPYGETMTYKEIANNINNPKAIRAVGTAIGKNPFFIVIPCHRVIGSDGKLTGFAYGLDIKRKLLEIESVLWWRIQVEILML